MIRALQRAVRRSSSWLVAPSVLRFAGQFAFSAAGWRSSSGRPPLRDHHRVLVIRLDEIGDMVLFSPFLRELRANLPGAWITLVVKPSVFELVRYCPYVNEVLTYDWTTSPYWGPVQRVARALRLARSSLWPRRFDLAIVPRWNADDYGASELAYISGAKSRVAYSEKVNAYKARANSGYDRLFTDVLVDGNLRHEVERNMELLRYLGGEVRSDSLEVWTTPEDESRARALLESAGVSSSETLVALGVSARHQRKIWPADRYQALAGWLNETYNARILIVGDESDARIGNDLRGALGPMIVNVAGRTTLRELAAIFRHVRLYVGNDTGPKHIAAAAGVPVVEISWYPARGDDPASPVAFAPWRIPGRVLHPDEMLQPCVGMCRAETAHCITTVSFDAVKDASRELLNA